MWSSLEQNVERYEELERQMADHAVIANPSQFSRVVREHGRLAKLVKPYQAYRQLENEIKQAEEMLQAETDAEMRKYAEEEVAGFVCPPAPRGRQQEGKL